MIEVLAVDASGIGVPVLSTLSTAVLLFAFNWVWRQIKAQLNEGRAATQAQLDRIEAQTVKTNGTVLKHTEDINDLKTSVKVDHEVLRTLYDVMLKGKPE